MKSGGRSEHSRKRGGGGDTWHPGAKGQPAAAGLGTLFTSDPQCHPKHRAAGVAQLFLKPEGKNLSQGTLDPCISLVGDWPTQGLDLNSHQRD